MPNVTHVPSGHLSLVRVDSDPIDTWLRYRAIVCAAIPVFCVTLLLYAFHYRWRRLSTRREGRSDRKKKIDELCFELGQHFAPSLVSTYQFKGMQPKTTTVNLSFENLGLQLHNGSTVLDGVTGEFAAGNLVAIMGPSGAGKTTFMNVLCGKASYGKMTGKVLVNSSEMPLSELKPVMGFVPQDDIVHDWLTVREQIQYSAELRNEAGMPRKLHRKIVEDVLAVLQIGHIQNSIVGSVERRGISGGQRKRVNIGLELAATPTLLFLDEPTSGLDSTSSMAILNSLKKMTQLGMTIIMVIHQPRYGLFLLFDEVLLLGKGGRSVYLGPTNRAEPYFEQLGFQMPMRENPADWFMDLISGEVPNTLISNFKPQMLFTMWEDKCHSIQRDGIVSNARVLTSGEDRAILAKTLEDEWDKIDINAIGVLTISDFKEVLELCVGEEVEEDLVSDLMKRIGGKENARIDREQFVEFILGMQSPVGGQNLVLESRFDDIGVFGAIGDVIGRGAHYVSSYVARQSGVDDECDLRRQQPTFCIQYLTVLHRSLVQFYRNNRRRFVDISMVVICSFAMGFLHKNKTGQPGNITMFHMGLALLTTVSCLKPFGDDQNVFFREAATGLNVWAFYLARITVDTVDVLVQCVLFVGIYYIITDPPIASDIIFIPCLLISVCCSSWGYLISAVIPPQNAVLAAVAIMVLLTGVFGNPSYLEEYLDGGFTEFLLSISVTRWSVQMVYISWVEFFPNSPETNRYYEHVYRSGVMQKKLDPDGYWKTGVIALLGYSVILRILGYICLLSQSGNGKRSIAFFLRDVLLCPFSLYQNCFSSASKKRERAFGKRPTISSWRNKINARNYSDME